MTEREMIEKAKDAGSAEQLKALAANEGLQMTDEEATQKFDELQKYLAKQKKGELLDDELDDVSGGGCHTKDGRLVVTVLHSCGHFTCKNCYNTAHLLRGAENGRCKRCRTSAYCKNCAYCIYEGGKWLCGQPINKLYPNWSFYDQN